MTPAIPDLNLNVNQNPKSGVRSLSSLTSEIPIHVTHGDNIFQGQKQEFPVKTILIVGGVIGGFFLLKKIFIKRG